MMLLEDQGKQLFRERGIGVPLGRTVRQADEMMTVKMPAIIKALVPVGGRGKAGGVVRASTREEATRMAGEILSRKFSGHEPDGVLVEELLPICREMYLAIVIDRSLGLPVVLAGRTGGVEVESMPAGAVRKWQVHPFIGVGGHLVRDVVRALDLRQREGQVGDLLRKLWGLFVEMDCELVEVNPLVLTDDGRLVAADAKVVVNDDSLYRHPGLEAAGRDADGIEAEARGERMSFVRLEGDIGVLANGAGLTMATMDEVVSQGGKVGAFLDLGGTDDPARVRKAFQMMARSGMEVVLVNIFGGMTRCDTVARGILDALEHVKTGPFTVVRIRGVNEALAQEMLQDRGIRTHTRLEGAVGEAVAGRTGPC